MPAVRMSGLLRVPPLWITAVALVVGLLAALALWQQAYLLGFVLWVLNRVLDGVDGTIARNSELHKQTDFGGYMDILTDFVVYAAVPIALTAGRPSPTLWLLLALLLGVFYVNAASWMYLAAILEKWQRRHPHQKTSINMPAGLVGGVETIVLFSLFILFPNWLPGLFALMTLLVAATVVQRVIWAAQHLPPAD